MYIWRSLHSTEQHQDVYEQLSVLLFNIALISAWKRYANSINIGQLKTFPVIYSDMIGCSKYDNFTGKR
jgi:hypothetical protein